MQKNTRFTDYVFILVLNITCIQAMKKLRSNPNSITKLVVLTSLASRCWALKSSSQALALRELASMMTTYLSPFGFPNR